MQGLTHWMRTRRRLVLGAALGAWLPWGLAGCGGSGGEVPPLQLVPVGSWMGALSDLREDVGFLDIPPPAITVFQDQTLRQIVRLSLGGERIRIRFGNLYGETPVRLARVHAALGVGGGVVDVGTDQAVSFQGVSSVVIAPGTEVWSDPVALRVPDGADLAVSVYVQEAADCTTAHRYANAVHQLVEGDQTRAATLPGALQLLSSHWMSAVDVYRGARTPVVVAFGDSLTDGNGSSAGMNQRYPDLLAQRLRSRTGVAPVAVVNAGLGGNRWLYDRFGLRGVARFRRDALGVSGVTHAIVQLGINDIGFQLRWTPQETATADGVIASLAAAVTEAKAAGVKVHVATLTPFKGHAYYSEVGEAMRQTVNAWVRTGAGGATGIIDFDAALRDPMDPAALQTAYRADDYLHVNDLGYQAMADCVPLERLA